MYIVYCLIGVLIGAGIICAILIPKVKKTAKLDEQIITQNRIAYAELTANEQRNKDLTNSYATTYEQYRQLREDLESESKKAEASAKGYYDKMMAIYQQKLDYDLQTKKQEFKQAVNNYKSEYETVLQDAAAGFQQQISQLQLQEQERKTELAELTRQLDDEASIVLAAVEANKRAAEMETQADFYRLNLSEDDLIELTELRKCAKLLRNPEPLNKVIWKVYYEKAYTDLVGRVVGSAARCGIYKITNLSNGMCYVGQAVNIADRWKQHIKRGLGADTPTRNKLYPAMAELGVENFSFEIIEDCDRILLNDREDYWQEYFKAKEFGYSIK